MKTTILKRKLAGIPLLEIFPSDKRNIPLKTIIFYHGWQSRKELVLTQARKLAAKNFRVIAPDAMNHGERFQEVSKVPSLTFWQSIQGNLFEFAYLKDALEKKNLILDHQLAVGGISMGGMTTCMLLTQHAEILGGACLMGTPHPTRYLNRLASYAKENHVLLPEDYFSLMSWIAPYDLALHPENINHRPILFWHGTKDERIDYVEVKDFYEDIKNKEYSDHISFYTGENEGHLVQPELMNLTTEFYEKLFQK